MVRRVVERGEAVPVALDLGAVGHVEAHAGEDLLDALQGAAHGVQSARNTAATGQGHVQGLGTQLQRELLVGQLLATVGQRGFDGLLGDVDGGAAGLLLFDTQRGHALHQLGDAARLAEELGLGVFELGGCLRFGEGGTCGVDQGVQLVHSNKNLRGEIKKSWSLFKRQPLSRGRRKPPWSGTPAVQNQAASLALTCSTMPAKAALSCTAMSASILRSISIPALRMPLANWL